MDAIDVTEPDANEADEQHPYRCRVSLRPDRYVYLSDGEVQDHMAWGTLLEVEGLTKPEDVPVPTPESAPAPRTPAGSGSGAPKDA